jgi:hypothetical protein
MKWSCLVNK